MMYLAKVKLKIEDDNGKIKKSTEQYLVEDAVSVTDAEAQVTKEFSNVGFDWELISVVACKIVKVLR